MADNTYEMPTLETERLMLRPFTRDDAAAAFKLFGDERANTFLPWFPVKTLDEARTFLEERYLSHDEPLRSYHYAICLKGEGEPFGCVNIAGDDSRDFGYALRSDMWHRGYASEAARAVMERARLDGVPYLVATHDVNNPRSGAVMRALGMTYRYSYVEHWMPKDFDVTFRLYQIDFADGASTYTKYGEVNGSMFVEEGL